MASSPINASDWFTAGTTTGFYPAPDSTSGNLYISNSPNTTTGGAWTNGTATWSNVPTLVNKKIVVKCSKCGAKIAEYWAKVPGPLYATDQATFEESDIMCDTCHKIEKLKE